ncbi:UDP-glucose iridoid glucosyltransferase-like [Malania oleifera]|uniref:UDP-glucose iridoid glucosyltransferase-like n=1 Tax=Malania oleifera TaxID=397392 RepID=UPI0025AE538D|nr:UDP-glucose iridoid glucosyltransferase-like [Malania oleifera]
MEMEMEKRRKRQRGGGRRRVVLVSFPLQGHVNPMLQLGNMLHSRGFSISLLHSLEPTFPAVNHSHFRFHRLSDGFSHPDLPAGDPASQIDFLNTICTAPLRDYLSAQLSQPRPSDENNNEMIAAVIYDGVMHFAEAVAHQLEIPSILLHTCSLAALLSYAAIPQFHRQGLFPPQDCILQEEVSELHPLRFKDLPFYDSMKFEGFLKLVATICNPKTSCAIIYNTIDFLEQPLLIQHQKQYRVPFFTIGPFHKMAPTSSSSLLKEDDKCIKWLNKQVDHSVIYVSFGSISFIEEKELTHMAQGLVDSEQPFLWVVRPDLVLGLNNIEPLLENFKDKVGERGCIVKWAPQKEVLAHRAIGGFWSHCGWNSTMESICEGIPMICRPFDGDQTVNARYLSHVWRVGLNIEIKNGLDGGEIGRTIRRLIIEEEGKEMRQRAIELKKKVELCVKEGGSSCMALDELIKHILSL